MCTLPPPRACVWTVNILAGNFVSPLAVTCSRYLERLVVQSKGALVVTVTIGPHHSIGTADKGAELQRPIAVEVPLQAAAWHQRQGSS